VEVPGYQFRVMAMDGRRVDRVLVVKLQEPHGPEREERY
jgi:CBS domain containing-hemolysin-like protein